MRKIEIFILKKMGLVVYCFKRALWLVVVSTMFSSMRLALSQQSLEEDMMLETNATNSCAVNFASVPCDELPALCLDCDFDKTCVYGEVTEYTCVPKESAQCNV